MGTRRKKPGFVVLDALWGGVMLTLALLLFLEWFGTSFRLTVKEQEKERADRLAAALLQNGSAEGLAKQNWTVKESRETVPGHPGIFLRRIEIYGPGEIVLSGAAAYEKK